MKTDILFQTHIFFVFILNGLLIGIVFDIFRILRKSFKTIDILTYVEDILFWLISGGITLYFVFNFNNGELRSYIFIGLIIGVILYMLLLSKRFIKINTKLLLIIKNIIIKILFPIKKMLIIILETTKKIIKFYKNFIHKSSNNLKNVENFIKKHFKIIKKKEKRDKYRII